MSLFEFLVIVNWAGIGCSLWSIWQNHRQFIKWRGQMHEATKCLEMANAARASSLRVLSVLMHEPGNKDVYRVALASLMDDDAVAERTKEAIARHLVEYGIKIWPPFADAIKL